MNKRRRFLAKRRRRAMSIALGACRVMEGMLAHEGFPGVKIRPTMQAIRELKGFRP